jgi:hypothetical protein
MTHGHSMMLCPINTKHRKTQTDPCRQAFPIKVVFALTHRRVVLLICWIPQALENYVFICSGLLRLTRSHEQRDRRTKRQVFQQVYKHPTWSKMTPRHPIPQAPTFTHIHDNHAMWHPESQLVQQRSRREKVMLSGLLENTVGVHETDAGPLTKLLSGAYDAIEAGVVNISSTARG